MTRRTRAPSTMCHAVRGGLQRQRVEQLQRVELQLVGEPDRRRWVSNGRSSRSSQVTASPASAGDVALACAAALAAAVVA